MRCTFFAVANAIRVRAIRQYEGEEKTSLRLLDKFHKERASHLLVSEKFATAYRIRSPLLRSASYQEVVCPFVLCKLLNLLEVVRASGFEPPTSWRMVKILVVPAAPRMNLTSSTGS